MLNLFILVILQQYEDYINKRSNPIELFNELTDSLKRVWNNYSSDKDQGFRIKMIHIIEVIKELDWTMLTVNKNKAHSIKDYITELKLIKDNNGFIYYYDFLFKLIKKELGQLDNKSEYINNEETSLNKRIKKKIQKYINNRNGLMKDTIFNTFNPLCSHLYYKISFNYIKKFIGINNINI